MKTLDLGLLFLRLNIGLSMLMAHGFPKYQKYAKLSAIFPDPFGLGSALSLSLVIFAELFCSLLLILGVWTRFTLIPLIITMGTAFFIIHADDPFKKKELAFIYLIAYITLFLLGSGKYALAKAKGLPNTKFWNFMSEKEN